MAPQPAVWWLGALIVVIAVVSPLAGPAWVPPVGVVVALLVAGLLLGSRLLGWLIALTAAAMLYDFLVLGWYAARVGELIVVAGAAAFAYRLSRTRDALGVQGLRSESMLVDLRDRLRSQGEMPVLPPGWESETVLRSAGAATFGGDFLVAAITGEGSTLEIALVDVSGKGADAGTRALLLSGALGGLLGAVPPEEFLPSANAYLLRQDWGEGFATAVHLVIDLRSGEYVVESAGHPPAAQFVSGSGTWRLIDSEGAVLGLLPKAQYRPGYGVLGRGDAMLIYTDGVVETAERELTVGIDKLLGEAERLVTRGFRDSARRLIDVVAPDASDDRALVVIWRN